MKRRSVVALLAAISFAVLPLVLTADEKEDAGVASAEKWLKKTDDGKYDEGWKDAAEYLRNAIEQATFEKSLRAVRKPLGKKVSRKVKSTDYRTALPGVPDGEYVVIQFETEFDNKKEAVETVTPMLEKDGTWRVSGYFIK